MLRYSVSVKKPSYHLFSVSVSVPASGSLKLYMPVWTPGSYLIREFSRNIRSFRASENGKQLEWKKASKNSWLVTGVRRNAAIEYDVYAYELSVDTSQIGDDRATINGAGVFLCPEGMENESVELSVTPWKSWKKVTTALAKKGSKYYAKDFDTLIDSPIHMGNHDVAKFRVAGASHEAAIYSPTSYDKNRFLNDLRRIVKASVPIFGEVPYKRYVFIIELLANPDSYGGLEHLFSTHCIAPILAMKSEPDYKRMLGLFSHEFFHLWNVKRLRPRPLGPFDYNKENYTNLLWVSEGLTSYYDNLILRRAGIFTVEDYLLELSDDISRFLGTPGRFVQSAEESSFDSWIKFYRPNEDSANSTISYYNKGTLLGFMLDMEIRKATIGKRNLDNVMRLLYSQSYKKGRWFEDIEFQQACENVSGKPLEAFFRDYAKGTKVIPFGRYLSFLGLRLQDKENEPKGFLGVKVKGENGKLIVKEVLENTPAREHGIFAGDELIGLDGMRLGPEEVKYFIENARKGGKTEIMISRQNKLDSIVVKMDKRPPFEKRIVAAKSASKSQKRLFSQWMKRKWGEIKYKELPASPLRKPYFSYL